MRHDPPSKPSHEMALHPQRYKYTMDMIVARKPSLFSYFKLLVPLALIFGTSVSLLKTQGDYLLPQQQSRSEDSSQVSVSPAIQRSVAPSVPMLQASIKNWSEPVLLFEEDGTGEIHSPFIISDEYGNLHVFWTMASESNAEINVIYYMRRDAIGWTTPVDILAADLLRAQSATVGQDGFIYLIWNGAGGISYSRAPLLGAEFVKNWSEPVLIADSNINAGIITSPTGTIHLAYPGTGTSGVFEQFLEPDSLYWSAPRMVSPTSQRNTAADWVQIRVSNNGTIHVVWTEFYYPESWPPRGVFYSHSIDGGNTWSAIVELAGDGYDQVYITATDDNNIHVAWNGMAGVGGRYHRWSSDGGLTWTETVEVIPAGVGGTEGFPQLVVDQSGTLNMLTTYDACAWYTYLKNQRWAPPVCISGEKAQASNYIEEPAMAISEGNKLHALFWDDRKRLWYTTKVTDAPWIPPEIMENELLEPTQSPVPTNSQVIAPTLGSTSLPVGQRIDDSSRSSFNSGQLLIFSILPVMLVVFLIVALRFIQKTR